MGQMLCDRPAIDVKPKAEVRPQRPQAQAKRQEQKPLAQRGNRKGPANRRKGEERQRQRR